MWLHSRRIDYMGKKIRSQIGSMGHTEGPLLDIGCGLGDYLNYVHDKYRVCVGIDPAWAHVLGASRNLAGKKVRVLQAVGESLPFQGKEFEVCMMIDVVEHVEHPELVLREAMRVVKNGGIILITTPDKAVERFWEIVDTASVFIPRLIKKIYWRLTRKSPETKHSSSKMPKNEMLTRVQLRELVLRAGLFVVKHERVCFYPATEKGGGIKRIYPLLRYSRFLHWIFAQPMALVIDLIDKMGVFGNKQLLVAQVRKCEGL